MSLSSRTFGWLRDGLGNLKAAREIEDSLGAFTFGDKWYVNPDATNASDDTNSGKSKAEPLSTVAEANDRATSNNHDIIYLSGNSAHAIASELVVSKNRLHFVGTGGGSRYIGQRTRFEMGVTTGSGIAIVKNTGNGNTFSGIKFRSVDTLTSSIFAFADGGEHTQISHCAFEKDEDLGVAGAAEFLANGDTCYYDHCTFGNTIYTVSAARQNILMTREQITGKVLRDCIWEDCLFLVKTSNTDFACLRSAAADDLERLVWFKRCMFYNSKLSSATPTDVFDITSDLTNAEIMLMDCAHHNITSFAVTTKGVFSNAPAGSATGGKGVEVT